MPVSVQITIVICSTFLIAMGMSILGNKNKGKREDDLNDN